MPTKKGGLGLPNTVEFASDLFETSKKSNEIITKAVLGEKEFSHDEHKSQVRQHLNASKIEKNKKQNEFYDSVLERSTPIQRKRLERNFESRNSAWLTVRILDRDIFCLSKSEFNDAIEKRYRLPLKALPSKCDGCGSAFDLPHALSCKREGLINLRHN